jgi:hypothetical protein
MGFGSYRMKKCKCPTWGKNECPQNVCYRDVLRFKNNKKGKALFWTAMIVIIPISVGLALVATPFMMIAGTCCGDESHNSDPDVVRKDHGDIYGKPDACRF